MANLQIYIDGSCSGNPGPGGWAAVCTVNGKNRKRCGNIDYGTNNQMELRALIEGMTGAKERSMITFFTDSNYLITCTSHSDEWLAKRLGENGTLWMEYITLRDNKHLQVKFVKVKGHSGDVMNDLADRLAREQCELACARR